MTLADKFLDRWSNTLITDDVKLQLVQMNAFIWYSSLWSVIPTSNEMIIWSFPDHSKIRVVDGIISKY